MSEQILQQEDTVSADRKQRIIFDPEAWKKSDKSGRTITSVTSRQNFNNSKYGNRKNKDDDEDDIKEEKSQIKFVTGNDAIATQVGQAKMKKDKVKKIAEAVIKKAVQQISIDKNVGIKEIPTNESTDENAVDMVTESTFDNASYTHIRALARKALREGSPWAGGDAGDPHAHDKWRQKEVDDKYDAEDKKKPKKTTYQVTGPKNQTHGPEHDSLEAAVAHRNTLKDHPDHKFMGINKITRDIKEDWEPWPEVKKPNTPDDAKLKADAKKNKEALDKIGKAFAKKKVDEEVELEEEQLDELKASTLKSYANKRMTSFSREKGIMPGSKEHKQWKSAQKAYDKAAAKIMVPSQAREEVEHIDELKKSTLGSYIQKASASAAEAGNEAGFKAGAKQPKYNTSDTTRTEKKRAAGIATAVKKLTKEGNEMNKLTFKQFSIAVNEAEMNEGVIGKKKPRPDRYTIMHKNGNPASLVDYADQTSAIKDRDANHPDAEVHQVGPRGKVKSVVQAAKKTTNEEVAKHKISGEHINDLIQSHGTHKTAKAVQKMHDLGHISTDEAKHHIEYINGQRPHDRRTKSPYKIDDARLRESIEQIDELSKETLGDYIKKANRDASSKILVGVTKGNTKDLVGANKDLRSAAKRNAGIRKAVDKLTKEGNEMNKLTFKQFVEQLDEMVEFVVTNEEVEQILEYTPGAGGVTKVQGRSYGANYHDPEGDDDADDKPAAKPAAKPAEAPAKRGRGRPAGSYGSYKARSAETRAAAAAKSAASKAANKAAKND